MFWRKKELPPNEFGIHCPRPETECALANKAITMYCAVWYGGNCGDCGEFQQGQFIGNFPMVTFDDDGEEVPIPMDESLRRAIETGIEISSL